MTSKKARNAIQQKVEYAELKQENSQLLKSVESLAERNNLLALMLNNAEQAAERYRQEAIRREVDNEYLEARNRTLRAVVGPLEKELDAAKRAKGLLEQKISDLTKSRDQKLIALNELRLRLVNTVSRLGILPGEASAFSSEGLIGAFTKAFEEEREQNEIMRCKWNDLFGAFEKYVKRLGVLQNAAADVYEFCFENDNQKQVRHLRRVLMALSIPFNSRTKEAKNA